MDTQPRKHWQTTIYHGIQLNHEEILYGESLDDLRNSVTTWLLSHQPEQFTNTLHTGRAFKTRITATYSDGTKQPVGSGNESPLALGWHYVRHRSVYGPYDLDHVVQVVSGELIQQRGPDYREFAMVESDFPMAMVRSIRKVSHMEDVEDMMQRGWYIARMLVHRDPCDGDYSSFILVHPERDAA